MKKVYIMRGIPGSGKSTKARELAGETGAIHSTDDYFEVDGEYRFDPRLLHRNHQLNFQAFRASLAVGVNPVIVDNTNIRRRDFKNYVKAAGEAGYQVEEIVIPLIDAKLAAQRNSHGVPEQAIQRMIDRWQD